MTDHYDVIVIRLDLTGLLHSPSALVRVPVFLVALLVVRGVPALLGLRENGPRHTVALGPSPGHVDCRSS